MTTLLAGAFDFERLAASGVLGAGVAVIGVTVGQWLKNPPLPQPGETVRRLKPGTAVALILLGIVLTCGGLAWRNTTAGARG